MLTVDPFYSNASKRYGPHDLPYPLPVAAKTNAEKKITGSWQSCLEQPELAEFVRNWTDASAKRDQSELQAIEYHFKYWLKELLILKIIMKEQGWRVAKKTNGRKQRTQMRMENINNKQGIEYMVHHQMLVAIPESGPLSSSLSLVLSDVEQRDWMPALLQLAGQQKMPVAIMLHIQGSRGDMIAPNSKSLDELVSTLEQVSTDWRGVFCAFFSDKDQAIREWDALVENGVV